MSNLGGIATTYHERTKHHVHRLARSLGYLDWATQPDPFRRFAGAPLVELPFRNDTKSPDYNDLFTPGAIPPEPVRLDSIGSLFELSLALSAWKSYQGSRWALRINPSSGNLHPTEGYLVAGRVSGLSDQAGVYHYAPREHALERRAAFASPLWTSLIGEPGCFLVGLTSIHWREAWKYGERAYRYCQEDAGHALAAIAFSAAVNGWYARVLDGVSDVQISMLLGLSRSGDFSGTEAEHPDMLIAIGPTKGQVEAVARAPLPDGVLQIIEKTNWIGHANRLSTNHVAWPVIDEVAHGCVKPETRALEPMELCQVENRPRTARRCDSAAAIIRQRRSAIAFDGRTHLQGDDFYTMLGRVLPLCSPPLSALGLPACIHLGLFVHRVTGLTPGLYCFPRTAGGDRALREAMSPAFSWTKPRDCPTQLPLFLLEEGDVTDLAAQVSCGQDIAGDSAFSLGFLAEFDERLRTHGDWFYRRLHWEAGAIAQVLYLEAEAVGLRGTGIGCFFDDAVHDSFGLRDRTVQSLYHFTLGGHVEDKRLTTELPYPVEMVQSRPATTAAV